GLERELPRCRAGDRLHHADQAQRLSWFHALDLRRDRHPVDHAHARVAAAPDCLDYVRGAPVLPVVEGTADRAKLEVATVVPIAQPAEDPGAIEARQAHPVDRSLLAEQRRRAQVAEHAVVGDRWIADVAFAHSSMSWLAGIRLAAAR